MHVDRVRSTFLRNFAHVSRAFCGNNEPAAGRFQLVARGEGDVTPITSRGIFRAGRLDTKLLDDYGLSTRCPFHSLTRPLGDGRLSCLWHLESQGAPLPASLAGNNQHPRLRHRNLYDVGARLRMGPKVFLPRGSRAATVAV